MAATTIEATQSTSSSSTSTDEKIKDLKKALEPAEEEITKRLVFNWYHIIIILVFLISLLAASCFFGYYILTDKEYDKSWTWQMIYYTFSRAVVVGALYYTASQCIGLLKSYLHIHERNSHRLLIIKSMPSLVEAKEFDSEKIYLQLLNIIVDYDENGILKSPSPAKPILDVNDILSKIIDKALPNAKE